MNLRILARRVLGRRGTFLLRNVVSELCYRLGIVSAVNDFRERDECVSAMVCTCNDPDWLEPSLVSVRELVDEYVVVDSSTDETPRLLEEIRDRYGLRMTIVRTPPGDLVSARNTAIARARCRWILHWDSDFIATPRMIKVVRSVIESVRRDRHYLVYWPHINMCGDPLHLCPNPLHIEHWLFTWSRRLRYEWVGRYDSLIAPLTLYRVIFIREPLSIHLSYVRKPERLGFKHIWWRFREEFNALARRGASFEELMELARRKAREVYGVEDLGELGARLIRDMVSRLEPFDEERFGPLPEIYREMVLRIWREALSRYGASSR